MRLFTRETIIHRRQTQNAAVKFGDISMLVYNKQAYLRKFLESENMHLYKAFGVSISSEVLIPQFIGGENQQADVSIKFGEVESVLPPNGQNERAVQIGEDEVCFFFEQIGYFLVRKGCEIIVDPYPGAEEQLIRLPLIGIALAALLQQRGMLVLHASAVCVGGEAIVFVGWKGAGKSTTTAMLYKRGHPMISDDIVAIENAEVAAPLVAPGFPNFKLMPETAASVFGDDPDTLSQVCTGLEKRFRPSSDNFLSGKMPLKAIYALEEGTDMRAQVLKPQEAITTLIANTFLARYGKQLLQNKEAIKNLWQCSNIVNRIPVYRLQRPKSFHLLDDLAELIESHSAVKSRAV